jgi:hypothetical protein
MFQGLETWVGGFSKDWKIVRVLVVVLACPATGGVRAFQALEKAA